MVLAYHVIFTAYGFWLPNDPRGSWSDFVGAWELFRFGPATKTIARRSVANFPHDRSLRLTAKNALHRTPVNFSGLQARAVGRGFQIACNQGKYEIAACSILPDHVHLVIHRHKNRDIETIVSHLKARASLGLIAENLHPFQNGINGRGNRPSIWAESFWSVYLDDVGDITRAIAYVENNPVKEKLPPQLWSFVRSRLAPALRLGRRIPALGPGLNL